MAQHLHVRFIDDLDGTDLGNKANTITFSFEGKDYSIDLSEANADTFREAMKPYINGGRRATGSKTKTSRRSTIQPMRPSGFANGLAPTGMRSPTAGAFPPR